MHRFFIEPKMLGYQAETYNRWDDPKWCALVDEFRWSIRLREWKDIDRRLRLFVKVEEWDGDDVLLIDNDHRDMMLADAYVKAGFLEGQAIMVFARHNIPWQRLKPFRASPGGRKPLGVATPIPSLVVVWCDHNSTRLSLTVGR